MKLVGISGSLCAGSYNSALLRAAAGLMPEGARLEIVEIDAIPLYNGDTEERDGIPASVADLKQRIAESAGLLVATPEYNHSVPGVLKNAIDWASRPPTEVRGIFHGKPVALMGASPNRFGTALAQTAWLPIFRTLGLRQWREELLAVHDADGCFDERGLVDPAVRERLRHFLTGFVAFIRNGGNG